MHTLTHSDPTSHSARAIETGVSQSPRSSWALPAPSGAYAPLRAWVSGNAWFDAVMDVLATPEGEALRRAARVAPGTLLRVAYDDRMSADRSTGRDVTTAHETVAERLGMSAKTVQRARLLLEAMGLAVTVVAGRYLTNEERERARRTHGGDQVRAASTRALVMPSTPPPARSTSRPAQPESVENVHLPVSPSGEQVSHLPESSPTRAMRARKGTAPRRPATTRRTMEATPRSLAVQQLAARLVQRMPWLGEQQHIGRLCRLVDRLKLVERGWTAQQIVDQIERHSRSAGLHVASSGAQRNPLGYFAWLVDRAISADELAPFEQVAQERQQRIAAALERAAAEQARRQQIAAEAAEIDAVIAAMRQQFPKRTSTPHLFV